MTQELNHFYMHNLPTQKDAVRIHSAKDIPEFLKNNIQIWENPENGKKELILNCVEGRQRIPLDDEKGKVIAFQTTDTLASGWNVWHKANAAETLLEKDGKFYNIPIVVEAAMITDNMPDFLKEAEIQQKEDGSFSLTTDDGVSTGAPGKALWMKYGKKENGTLDANILTITEKSINEYIVCDKDGNDLLNPDGSSKTLPQFLQEYGVALPEKEKTIGDDVCK